MKAHTIGLRGVLSMLLVACSMSAMSQVQITGTVYEPTGEVCIGANVLEKGTTNGTVTDFDGNYSISVSSGKAVLVFSYVGMRSQEVAVDGKTSIIVHLQDDSEALEEVVVVGYGTMKKSDVAGATVSMNEEKLRGTLVSSLDQTLQGRAAGVQAVATSGAPGSSSSIRVRGTATVNANAEPLYVIDGVIMQSGGASSNDLGFGDELGQGATSTVSPLATINPADIVSMEILKDASATAIYGAQGANGVVLITTKRGQEGKAKFTYDGMVAVNQQTKRLNMMNLREYAQYYNDFVRIGEVSTNDYYADPSTLGVGTNWQDALFRTAVQHQHQVSVQGGTDKVKYYVSGNYMSQQGTIIGSDFQRVSGRANLDAQLASWAKMGVNLSYNMTKENLKMADSNEGLVYYALISTPSVPIYNLDGSYSTVAMPGYNNPNPIAMAMSDDINLKRRKLTGSIFFDITPYKYLTWHTEFDWDVNGTRAETFKPTLFFSEGNKSNRTENYSRIQKNTSTYWAVKNYITYAQTISAHSFSVMLGQELWQSRYDYTGVENTSLPSDEVQNPVLGQGTPKIYNGYGKSSMASFFARATYNYDNRYLATYTFRYDGSSNFGPQNRWAPFHSFALAWRFSQEPFMENAQSWLSNGKLRAGWGQTGNANIGAYRWGSPFNTAYTDLGLSYIPAQIPNEAIHWEKQQQTNVGLDLGFLQERIALNVDWYYKESKDMLMQLSLPIYMGTSANTNALAAPYGNYGTILNTGVEVTLDVRPVDTKQFTWNSEVTMSFNRNRLLSLSQTGNDAPIKGYALYGNTDEVTLTEVGQPLFGFYGYLTDGVYTDLEDIKNSPTPEKYPSNGVFDRNSTVWVGDVKFVDYNKDGKIDANDKTYLGSPFPIMTLGWNNSFSFYNFTLSVFLNASVGNKVANYFRKNIAAGKQPWANQLVDVLDHANIEPIDPTIDYSDGHVVRADGETVWNWYDDINNIRVSNPNTTQPRLTQTDPNDNNRFSDRYIEDGSYLRIKNISLSYNFDKKLVQKAKMEALTLTLNFQNVATFTKYTGYDPEIGASTSSANVYGLDNGRYPSPTTYSLGLSITF